MLAACMSPKEKALKEIEAFEVQDSTFSIDNMVKLKAAYIAFADKYPDDERTPEFLFRAAQHCNVLASQDNDMKQHEEAVQLFGRIRTSYPKHEMAEEAMFLTAYIYENHMGDTARARALYNEFIAAYPNGELTEEARMAIRNLNVPLLDIINRRGLQPHDTAGFVRKQ